MINLKTSKGKTIGVILILGVILATIGILLLHGLENNLIQSIIPSQQSEYFSKLFNNYNDKAKYLMTEEGVFFREAGTVISTTFAENHEQTITIVPAASSSATVDIIVDIHYDLEMLETGAYYPIGSLSIIVPAPNLDTTSTTFQYDTSAGDQIFDYQAGTIAKDGYITLTNVAPLNSTVSGDVKVRFVIPVRNCMPDEDGNIIYTGMKAELISIAPGYEAEEEAEDLTFTITTRKDATSITKTQSKTTFRPRGLENLPGSIFNGNLEDYYFVDFRIVIGYTNYTRAVTEVELSDIITNGGTLVQLRNNAGVLLWYTGEASPAGYTINGTSLKYTSVTTNFNPNIVLTVMYKKSDFPLGVGTITNTAEYKVKYKGSTEFDVPKTSTTTTTVDTYAPGFEDNNFEETDYVISGILYSSVGTNSSWRIDEINTTNVIYDYIWFGKRYDGSHGNIEIGLDLPQAVGEFSGGSYYELLPEDMNYYQIRLRAVPGCSKISLWGMGAETDTTWQLIQDNINNNVSNTIAIPSNLSYRLKVIYHDPEEYININEYSSTSTNQITGYIRLTATGVAKLISGQINKFETFHSMDCVNSGVGHIDGIAGAYTGDAENLEAIHMLIYNKYKYFHMNSRNVVADILEYTTNLNYNDSNSVRNYIYNGTTKYYENTITYRYARGTGSVVKTSSDFVHLLPMGIEYISGSESGTLGEVIIIDNFNGTNRQLVILKNTASVVSIKTRIVDINVFNGTDNVSYESYLVITEPDTTVGLDCSSGGVDNGTVTNAWVDLNQNGIQDEYVRRATSTIQIQRTLDSSAQAIKTQVKTTDMSAYGTSGQETIGKVFSYKLSVSTLNNTYKNVVLYDVLPHVGDELYNGAERGSEADLIFVDIDLTEAQSMGYNPVIYYSTSNTPGDLSSGNWTTVKPVNPADIKAVAIDFGEEEFESDTTVAVHINVKSAIDITLKDKQVNNTFYYEKKHYDEYTDTWIQDIILETSPAEVTFSDIMPSYTIEKELAPGQSDVVLPGSTVNYVIKVTNTGEIDIHNLIITDSLDTLGTWTKTIATLPAGTGLPGDTGYYREYTFSYTVPTTATNNQIINNIATLVSDEIPDPITDDEDITVKMPGLDITKTLAPGQSDVVLPGSTVNYVIRVENTGDVALHNVIVTDSLDTEGTWTKTISTLPAGTGLPGDTGYYREYTFSYTVPSETANNNEIITNVAMAVSDETEEVTDDEDVTVKVPSYKIEKELAVGQNSIVLPGSTVNYVIRVTNTGEVDINNLVITDSLDVGGAWTKTIAMLPAETGLPGDTAYYVEYTFSYTLPTTATNNQIINNVATVVSDEIPDPITDDEDITVKEPGLWVTKELATGQSSIVLPGSTVNYVIRVENTGDVALHNVVVTDSLDTAGTWTKTIVVLEAGGSREYTFTYTLPVTATNNQVIKNVVTATSDETEDEEDDEDVTVKVPGLSITKELASGQSDIVKPGGTVSYVIRVENTGEVALNNVVVTDSLDTAGTWTKTIVVLEAGGSREYTFTYAVPVTATNNQVINNVATATSDETGEVTDDADVTVKVPGLSITKELATGQASIVLPGETVTYKIVVTNTGDVDLHNVAVTDSLDTAGTWTKTIVMLEAGGSREYTFTYTLPVTAINNQVINNVATAESDETGEVTDDADVTVKVPGLNITKTLASGQSDIVKPGDTVNYVIRVENTGEVALNNVVVTDSLDTEGTWTKTIATLPAGTGVEGDTGYFREYTFTYMVPVTATNNQVINNIATATSDETGEEKDDVDVTVKIPGLDITKTLASGQSNTVKPGDTVNYVIRVENTGEVDLHNVIVKDSLDTAGTWTKTILVLKPGESKEFTFAYTVPVTATNNQVIKNVARATSDETGEEKDDVDITVKVTPVAPEPPKTTSPKIIPKAGDSDAFTFGTLISGIILASTGCWLLRKKE